MTKVIDIQCLRSNLDTHTLLDVRTPAEFEKGHIPQAFNLPLFTNEERTLVGTIYKQESPEAAMKKGLELVGPKMAWYVEVAEQICPDKKVIVHCWRGGKRSKSLAWLLGMAGFDTLVLNGGYKAYRQFVQASFKSLDYQLLVLGGRTGCGKTQLLRALKKQGEQLLDLEALARHKGSAFGWIGEEEQPTVEQFENNLYQAILELNLSKHIWVENESRGIGKVYLPEGFWGKLKAAPLINIQRPFEQRVQILIDTYVHDSKDDLIASFQKIKKRLGGLQLKEALDALEQNDLKTAAAIALRYYDKTYQYNLEKNKAPEIYNIDFGKNEENAIVEQLLNFCKQV